MDPSLRPATIADAAAIAEIYNQAVLGSTASFDTEPKSPADRERWLAEHGAGHPVLVLLDDESGVAGWGSLSRWSDRAAYDATVEISIYVDSRAQGRGFGAKLMAGLLERASEVGLHAIVARIVSENTASIRLCERFGFTTVGTLHECGRKFDRWLDVVYLEKLL